MSIRIGWYNDLYPRNKGHVDVILIDLPNMRQ